KGAGRTPNGFWTNLSIFLLVLLAWFIYTVGIGSVFDLLSINGRIIESGWFGSYQDLVLGAVNMMPQFLATWLLMPVAAAAYTGHYFDRRVRLEAYDVKVLTED